ncbi:hypothetical protein [Parasitella parasitica]|uniref:Kinesin motor domain-containing protein n=1 Tax=Parasitella parasitica TaxID=35722 RepID=A0A0B7MVV1_9FUNG|nr:hypothetical protein [Parasitella parasitica]
MSSLAAARPVINVYSIQKSDMITNAITIPSVYRAPIRPDIVRFVHANMAKNKRQPYAVSTKAGEQTSANSWGTGRAVARIPRVNGSGTQRAGQAAFGNMCRGGRMFAPTNVMRQWHVKINVNQRRFATVSALAASGLPSLVMARGHRISKLEEVPMVVEDKIESLVRTREAVETLKSIHAYSDVEKVIRSRKLRAGQGKLRNRRFRQRRGPLIVYNRDNGLVKAFRNILGVEVVNVRHLNVLQLAPGGHLGRFIIWSESAFALLDELYGTYETPSSLKKNYQLPDNIMANPDVSRLINSDEIQSVVRPAITRFTKRPFSQKKNPLKNQGIMNRLNPYAQVLRRTELLHSIKKLEKKKPNKISNKKSLRIRPLTDRDRNQPRFANIANDDVLKIHDKTVQVVPQNKLFTFDHVFGTASTQEEIFTSLGDSLIRKFVEGYNITILAYGQTSSGKTYTMGTAANSKGMDSPDEGIVPRSMALLFDLLNNNNDLSSRPISPATSISSSTSASTKNGSRLRPKSRVVNRSSHIPHIHQNNYSQHKTKFTVKVSFIEIYNEDLHDLLNAAPIDELPPITIREDTKGRIYWTGVKEVLVHSTDDVLHYLERGTQNRATGATDMNEKSSRSHAIFSVFLKQEKWIPSSSMESSKKSRPASSLSMRSSTPMSNSRLFNASQNNQQQDDGEWLITTSKFNFVDLAGSERVTEGDRRKEGININAGLLALGNVISALGDPSKKSIHVPYRDSKLTRLLQDSLGGSATTLMIACASPVEYNLAETLNTLQYANRARNIKNRSEKNQVEEWMTTENIELLRTMIEKLKNELNYLKTHNNGKLAAGQQHMSVSAGNEDIVLDDISSASSSTTSPSFEDTYHEQQLLISDLQRQLEELDGEASVTRERNRIVEKELQRLRLLENMTRSNKEESVDFQHLVEPVIEEYEKSVAKLESQLALARAALHHSDTGREEQQAKIGQLESLMRIQESSITELRLRLSKVLEREQSNENYIHELELKLMKSVNETTRDQEMLNELKNRIMKFKETDENTEQYITDLEQRLAAGEAERARLQKSVESLESKVEAKERANVELLRRLSKATSNASTEKLILKELEQINAKYKELIEERDSLQLQVDQLHETNRRMSNHSLAEPRNNSDSTKVNDVSLQEELQNRRSVKSSSMHDNVKMSKNRKSFADETETTSSTTALNLLQAEIRVKEETERANRLQQTLDRLQHDHKETIKELDEVLQRYHEISEQVDLMEGESSLANAQTQELPGFRKSLDLSKEIAQAKEKDEYEQEKLNFENRIQDLQHRLQSFSKQMAIKDSELAFARQSIQELEKELGIANEKITQLQQSGSEQETARKADQTSEKLNDPTSVPDPDKEDPQTAFKALLDAEKKQSLHWKLAHSELQQDIDKLTLDLDGKEQYILQLKQEKESLSHLKSQLDETNQQSTSLQKRLAETLASLTVLKIAHDGLQKKMLSMEKDSATAAVDVADNNVDDKLDPGLSNFTQEKADFADKLQSEAAVAQRSMATETNEINAPLKDTQLEKEKILQKLYKLEQKLKDQTENTQNSDYLEQEKIFKAHNEDILQLTQQFATSSMELKAQVAISKQELDDIKLQHQVVLKNHDADMSALIADFERASQQLEESKAVQERLRADHEQEVLTLSKDYEEAIFELEDQVSGLESELEASKDLHQEILSSHSQRLQVKLEEAAISQNQIQKLQTELETIKSSHSDNVDYVKAQHNQLVGNLEEQIARLELELQDLRNLYAEKLKKVYAQHEEYVQEKIDYGQILLNQAQIEIDAHKAEKVKLTTVLKKQEQTIQKYQEQLINLNERQQTFLDDKVHNDHHILQQMHEGSNKYKNEKEEPSSISNEQAHSLHEPEELKHSHKDQVSHIDTKHKKRLDEQIHIISNMKPRLNSYKYEVPRLLNSLQEQEKVAKEDLFALKSMDTPVSQTTSVSFTQREDQQQKQQRQEPQKINIVNSCNDRVSKKIALLESQLAYAQSNKSIPSKNQTSSLQIQLQDEINKNKNLATKLDSLNIKHDTLLTELSKQHKKKISDNAGALAVANQKQRNLQYEIMSGTTATTTTTHDENDELLPQLAYPNITNIADDKQMKQEQQEQLINANNDQDANTAIISAITQELENLREDCSKKEAQLQQLQEENSEYALLSSELEKEIDRMTHCIEDLQFSEELVHQLLELYELNDKHQLMATAINERKRSDMSVLQTNQAKPGSKVAERAAVTATKAIDKATQGRSSDENNGNNDGSGAISQQQGPSSSLLELKKQLDDCHKQISKMVTRDDMLDLQDKLNQEKEKYAQAERARRKLEKQLEEVLSRKKFMCF